MITPIVTLLFYLYLARDPFPAWGVSISQLVLVFH